MFKGFSGLKNVVKGGFSAVAEQTGNLRDQVVSDPSTSQGHLKESLKQKFSSALDSGEKVIDSSEHTGEAKEKAKEVAHKVKHYGAFGEDYLGYSDPTKELRKAVKKKEKEAKKARKAKKKKTGKKDDLFDPENLAKYKLELEEKKKEREAALADASLIGQDRTGESSDHKDKEEPEDKPGSDKSTPSKEEQLKFTLDLAPPTSGHSSARGSAVTTPAKTPKETEDWEFFARLTSGVDNVIQKKKEELKEIKVESYYQQKKTGVQLEEEEKEQEEHGKKKKDKKKKKWADLDNAEFEDKDGIVSGGEDHKSSSDSEGPDVVEDEDQEDKEVDRKASDPNDIGLVEIPDDPIDWDADDDIFNTGAAEAVLSGDIKLAIIPDDLVYDDEDDPFSTKIADDIVKFDREKKRKEASKLKFTGLSSVADVLAGRKDKVDKDLVDVTVKSKRRRANRINLIAEDQSDVTKVEDIGTIVIKSPGEEQRDFLTTTDNGLAPVPVGDLLTATPSPAPISPADASKKTSTLLDLQDFEELETRNTSEQLTSNVAILAGEFTKAAEEEADDFDAAFDALAQESVTKYKIEELEKEFEDEDVFDTTTADKILGLVSLANKVEIEEEPLENWDDKDPFDTTAYDDITGDLEDDLGFESLAKRDPEEDTPIITVSVAEIDPFLDLSKGSDAFGGIPGITVAKVPDVGWAAFKSDKKPNRPPPPKPAPPRPKRPLLAPQEKSNVSVVVKAPSTESIKSWNCATADNLITKSKIEALANSALEEDSEEEEFDPFDTSNYKDVTEDIENQVKEERIEDPFDTSAIPDFKESDEKNEEDEEDKPEEQIDLLADIDSEDKLDATLVPIAKDIDPFDTEFASDILPNKGDPFDTSFVKGAPGKAELRALEEEFIDKEEFDPRPQEGTSIPRKQVAPGTAGRQRPSAALRGLSTDLEIKAPPIENTKLDLDEEEDIEDPFDTSIVNKVIPVRKAKHSSEISVEDQDFDPTSTFQEIEIEEIDPFDTSAATYVIPELRAQAEAEAKAKAEEEERKAIEKAQADAKVKENAIAEAAAKLASKIDEEFIDKEKFDPRPQKATSIPRKKVAPGTAVRQRPSAAAKLASKIDEDKPLSTEPLDKPLPQSLSDDDFDPRA